MELLHTADSHLGFQAYRKVDDDGVNLREADVYEAFDQVVDQAIDRDVDLLVHAGDLFDSVRPSNRAIDRALRGLLRVVRAGIPVVVIAGNHETPRMRSTGNVFSVLEHFDGLHPVHAGRAETIDVAGVTVHAVPHVPTQDRFEESLDDLDPGSGTNVLVLHGTAPGVEGLPSGEFNDLTIPPDVFDPFDYVALGHYHVRTRVADRVWYSGSPERLTFAEADVDKGCLVVDPDAGDVEPVPIDVRPMVQPAPIDCSGLDPDEVREAVEAALDRDLDDALVKVKLVALPKEVYQALDLDRLRESAQGAVHVEISPEVVRREDGGDEGSGTIGALTDEFASYLQRVPVDDLDKERLASMAKGYLEEAQDAPSGA